MKKSKAILVILISGLFVFSVNAQTDAGKILVGGSSSFSFGAYTEKHKSDEGDGTDGKGIIFTFIPQAGYFIIDGLAAGLKFDIILDSYKPDGYEAKYRSTTFIASPFVRYYYGAAKIKPFAEAAVGLGSYKEKWPTSGGTTETATTKIFAIGFKIGGAYFINDNVSLELGLNFDNMSEKDKEDNPYDVKYITSNIGLEFGIAVVF